MADWLAPAPFAIRISPVCSDSHLILFPGISCTAGAAVPQARWASRPRLAARIISGKRITGLFMFKSKKNVSIMTMQQRLGWQAATSRNSLGQLFPSLGRGHRRGRHKPRADHRWLSEVMRLDDRVVLSGSATAVGFTPAQVKTAYGIDSIRLGSVIGDGTDQTIAIVDFGDDPTIASDLHNFDLHFNLPDPPSFTKVNQNGVPVIPGAPTNPPPNDNRSHGGSGETALDVEWAHAIAPGASIVLVESNSNAPADWDAAVRTAANLPGGVSRLDEFRRARDDGRTDL